MLLTHRNRQISLSSLTFTTDWSYDDNPLVNELHSKLSSICLENITNSSLMLRKTARETFWSKPPTHTDGIFEAVSGQPVPSWEICHSIYRGVSYLLKSSLNLVCIIVRTSFSVKGFWFIFTEMYLNNRPHGQWYSELPNFWTTGKTDLGVWYE